MYCLISIFFYVSKYLVCKRKLESKCQALLILTKEMGQCRSERDQFKLMAEQLRERYQGLKKQLHGQVNFYFYVIYFFVTFSYTFLTILHLINAQL